MLRVLLIGTALAILPAAPFYIYTFDASLHQITLLIPLFLPAVVGMIITDVGLIRAYLAPVKEFLTANHDGAADQSILARQRCLNLPAFAVFRVFVPHAIVGSGIFNLMILYGNAHWNLGIRPSDFPLYWVINLTVVPVGHAVYEYFAFSSLVIPILKQIDDRSRGEIRQAARIVNIRLAIKVTLLFIMLGTAPLFILGVSLNRKHTSLLLERERERLLQNAELAAGILGAMPKEAWSDTLNLPAGAPLVLVQETGKPMRSLSGPLQGMSDSGLIAFMQSSGGSPFYSGRELLAAKAPVPGNQSVVSIVIPVEELFAASRGLQAGTMIIIAVALILVIGLLMLVARDIDRSTGILVSALKEVEHGNFDHAVRLYTTDEFSVIGGGINQMMQGLRERNLIRDTFGKYVAPAVMEKVLDTARQAGAGNLQLASERKVVTVLFSDVRNFTRRTEEADPEAIVEQMNAYYERMVSVVDRFEGTVDKFIGDALMVLFGAPVSRPDDADRAVASGLAMRKELRLLNREFRKRKIKPLAIGIGIHTGEVIAGNIGSPNRLEYTVLGDAVNVASRIEGLTKKVNADMLLSEATVRQLKQRYAVRKIGRMSLKGKRATMVVYKAL